jgi:hypothetical protein
LEDKTTGCQIATYTRFQKSSIKGKGSQGNPKDKIYIKNSKKSNPCQEEEKEQPDKENHNDTTGVAVNVLA